MTHALYSVQICPLARRLVVSIDSVLRVVESVPRRNAARSCSIISTLPVAQLDSVEQPLRRLFPLPDRRFEFLAAERVVCMSILRLRSQAEWRVRARAPRAVPLTACLVSMHCCMSLLLATVVFSCLLVHLLLSLRILPLFLLFAAMMLMLTATVQCLQV